jgi:hypothetical protein
MQESSRLNYGFLNITVTQSGSTVLSEDSLRAIFTEDNEGFETIPGKWISPSGGLYEKFAFINPVHVRSLPINDLVVSGDPFIPSQDVDNTSSNIIAVDLGSPKTVDRAVVSLGEALTWLSGGVLNSNLDEVVALYTSSDNSTWTREQFLSFSGPSRGTLSFSFTPVTSRYVAIAFIALSLGSPGNAFTQGSNIRSVTATQVYFYDSASFDGYEMDIDLEGDFYVTWIQMESQNPPKFDAHPLVVETKIGNNEYKKASGFYLAGFNDPDPADLFEEASSNHLSPTGSFSAGYLSFYNEIDNSIYNFRGDRFRKFDLGTRQWSVSSARPYFSSGQDLTFDRGNNTAYGIGQDGVLWKYDVYTDSWDHLSGPDSSLGPSFSSAFATISYVKKKHALYLTRGGVSSDLDSDARVFYKYSIEDGSWERMADVPGARKFDKFQATSIYDEESNVVFLWDFDSSRLRKYSVASDSWSIQSFSEGAMYQVTNNSFSTSVAFDTKRRIFWPFHDPLRFVFVLHRAVDGGSIGYPLHRVSSTALVASGFSTSFFKGMGFRSLQAGQGPYHGVYNSGVYVPTEDRIYYVGSTNSDSSQPNDGVISYTVPLGDIFTTRFAINRTVRNIRIKASDLFSFPLRIKRVKIGIAGCESSSCVSSETSLGIPPVGIASSSEEVFFFNNTSNFVESGTAYIQPDGSLGSRYMEISPTSSGTFTSHCVHNDLNSFSCLVDNKNYDTEFCGSLCTVANGGPLATGEYTTAFIDLHLESELSPSSQASVFVRTNIPEGKRKIDIKSDIVVNFEVEKR